MAKKDEIFVLNKRVRLLQPRDGFRTSLDSVMLAAACPAKKNETVLDLGCGVGGAGFCVLERVPDTYLAGVDIQQDHVDLALKNIPLNQREDRAEFTCSDIRKYKGRIFHHAICNPPFLDKGTHTPSPSKPKATALYHSEEGLSVKDWIDCAFRHLKPGGSFTIIHRADHIDKIIQGFGARFGAVEIIPLWPRAGVAAKRIILRARKGRKSPCILQPGIILHQKNGNYTDTAQKILRGGGSV